jgi:hypothetical protein
MAVEGHAVLMPLVEASQGNSAGSRVLNGSMGCSREGSSRSGSVPAICSRVRRVESYALSAVIAW